MSKSSHFIGQPIYSQILKLTNQSKIRSISKKGNYDHYAKKLDGYTHFVTLLFGILMRYDSLREIIIGMLSESNKLQHLGINYLVKRSTLSDANKRRDSSFFSEIYFYLLNEYRDVLSDKKSRKGKEEEEEEKDWVKLLHIMDSTTISLFSNILKGAGRNPKNGKKKGGIKVHTVLKADEGVPYQIHFSSAATHDHVLLKKLELSSGAFLAMDRAYIDYAFFEQLTEQGVFYVTKMKKNLRYEQQEGNYLVDTSGKIILYDSQIVLKKEEIVHQSRLIKYWDKKKKTEQVLLTNNFHLHADQIVLIYQRRWQIESLFKQLKQNFPLKYFFGETVNAIQSQIWVTLIANLLLSVIKKRVKRKWSFSNLVTMVRQCLMYYIDLFKFCEEPEKTWLDIINKPPQLEYCGDLFEN